MSQDEVLQEQLQHVRCAADLLRTASDLLRAGCDVLRSAGELLRTVVDRFCACGQNRHV